MSGAVLFLQQTYNIVEIYARLGLPIVALSALIIATWCPNVMNAYSSGLALTQLLHWPSERRRLATLIAGVLGSLLAASGLLDNIQGFLVLMTVTLPPIAGVLVSDFWIARTFQRDLADPWRLDGLLAWAFGVGAMLVLTHPIRSVIGIVVAAGAHFALSRAGVSTLVRRHRA